MKKIHDLLYRCENIEEENKVMDYAINLKVIASQFAMDAAKVVLPGYRIHPIFGDSSEEYYEQGVLIILPNRGIGYLMV